MKELREQDKFAIEALENLLGISYSEGEKLIKIAFDVSDTYIHRCLYSLFDKGVDANGVRLKDLRYSIKEYCETVKRAMACPAVKKLEESDIDSSDIKPALIRVNAPKKEEFFDEEVLDTVTKPEKREALKSEPIIEYSGEHSLSKVIEDLCSSLDAYVDGMAYSHITCLADILDEASSNAGLLAANRLLSDFITEASNACPFAKSFSNSRTGCVPFVVHTDEISSSILAQMKEHRDDYLIFKGSLEARILGLLSDTKGISTTSLIANGIRKANGSNKTLVFMANLLEACPAGRRPELFDTLTPESYIIYSSIKKHGVSNTNFIDFLVLYSSQKCYGSGSTLQEIILELIRKGRTEAAAFFVEHASTGIAASPDFPLIMQIASSSAVGDIIIKHYHRAKSSGENNKARIYLSIGLTALSPQLLKEVKYKLETIPDDELLWAAQGNAAPKAILRYSPVKKAPMPAPAALQKRLSWEESLIAQLNGKINDDDTQRLRNIMSLLGDDSYRLRTIYSVCGIDALLRFVEDAGYSMHSAPFRRLLKSQQFFREYLKRLAADDKKIREGLRQGIPQENADAFLQQLFYGEQEEEAEAYAATEPSVTASQYKRAVLIGGDFDSDSQQQITRAVNMPVVFDSYGSRKIRYTPYDIVLCVTPFISHPSYWATKARAKKSGAGYFHLPYRSPSKIVSFLQDKAGSGGSSN